MKVKLNLLIVFFLFLSCSNDSAVNEELANLEYHLNQFITLDGVPVNAGLVQKNNIEGNKLVFAFSDSHCLDCISKNMQVLSQIIKEKLFLKTDIILVSNFKDSRLLRSFIYRFNLDGIVIIPYAGKVIEIEDSLFDQPTFFYLKTDQASAHFLYQPTLFTTKFSDLYLRSIAKKFKRSK
ncbi:hypothetical protein [Roseivirga misakiensis]|uniref:Alkyl hydroperoxide reductase subunit C/ Thiol specific antioxidant domain-containing protein n=1 Tax=Roseivirga misakiensis TaxID=1563681 RepID=A0A1E5T7U8_9BACT|nr:hypothetical protein [Roseivirga misakiensis]OEK07455.1 hypothetical protein BFP71_00155 [Roseivirga misakiensis]